MEDKKSRQVNFWGLVFLVSALVIAGILGYMFIEGWSILDALYMVVITLATVGFKEVHPLSPAGKVSALKAAKCSEKVCIFRFVSLTGAVNNKP